MPRRLRPALVLAAVVAAFAAVLLLRPGRTAGPADVQAQPPVEAPKFVIAPYLQYPTQTSITVMWETPGPGTSVVEYGLSVSEMKRVEGAKDATIHEVRLDGLGPETRYVYRVSSTLADGTTIAGAVLQFMTAVKADSAFSFAVVGDTQKNPRMTAKVAKVMYDRRPHFVVHCGDVVDSGPDKAEWVHELFAPCAELFARCPVFPTIGNHEKDHAWYYRYFSLPDPEYRYRYRYGNADFFVVDSNRSLRPESEQYGWLEDQLGRSDATWKFVYHHHPAWTSDADDYGDTLTGPGTFGDPNVRGLVKLYEKHKVDVVFNGHIHLYERTWPIRDGKVDPRGVVYVTSGGGGGKLEEAGPLPTWFKAQLRVDFHCCYVNVHGRRLSFQAFDHNGQLFDAFEREK
jgi:predicted phosphodiesterase